MRKLVLFAELLMFLLLPACFNQLMAQVTIGSLSKPDSSAVLDLQSNNKRGLLLPRVTLRQTTDSFPLPHHIAGMTVFNTNTVNDVTPGYYFDNGSQWVRLAADGPATPKFFYMPPMLLPTSTSDPAYSAATQMFSVDLYGQYQSQFTTTIKNTGATVPLPLYPASDLEFYVTYYDPAVFATGTVSVSDIGLLTYKLVASPVITAKTYMNIIFEVKQ